MFTAGIKEASVTFRTCTISRRTTRSQPTFCALLDGPAAGELTAAEVAAARRLLNRFPPLSVPPAVREGAPK